MDRLAECFDELVMNATRWLDKEPKRIRVSVAGSASESLPSTLDGYQGIPRGPCCGQWNWY